MKTNIINYLKNEKNAKALIEINDFLKLETSDELANLQKELNELINEGIVYETKKQKYMLIESTDFLASGEIEIAAKGYGFVIQKGTDDIFVNKDNLNGAIDKDLVLVELFERNKKIEGKVIKILNSS